MTRRTILFLGGQVAVLAVTLGWVWHLRVAAGEMRVEAAVLQSKLGELERLKAERDRLLAEPSSETELARLRGDHEALVRLKAELGALKNEAEENVAHPKPAKRDMTPAAGPLREAAEWRASGSGVPIASFESVLVAVRDGKVDELAKLLFVSIEADKALKDALKDEPEAVSRQNSSNAQFLAAAMMRELQPGNFQLVAQEEIAPDVTFLTMRLPAAKEERRDTTFMFVRQAAGWQLAVPSGVAAYYAEQFKATRRTGKGGG